jgi:hypothetical protein
MSVWRKHDWMHSRPGQLASNCPNRSLLRRWQQSPRSSLIALD